ncbi:hypothetical protein [Rhizobium sp.]
MKAYVLSVAAGLAFALAGAAAPLAAETRTDCSAPNPEIEVPGSATVKPGEKAENTLTEKLTTCGSVLAPPPLGDVDIVEPAPRVGDDINIHPDAPAVRP